MIEISIKDDFDLLVNWARSIADDQVDFAAALALTRTAQDAKAEIEKAMGSVFDRPTPYTMRGLRLYPARKKKLVAEIAFRPAFGSGTDARDYLAPEVFGGVRKLKAFEKSLQNAGLLPAGMYALPGGAAKLDQYGNMSRSQIVQLLSYFRAFGEQGYRANITDKRKAQLARGNAKKGQRGVVYFVGRPGGGRLPLGIWERTSFGAVGSAVRPLVIFIKHPIYRARLQMEEITKRVVQQRLEPNFNDAWRQALATAKGRA